MIITITHYVICPRSKPSRCTVQLKLQLIAIDADYGIRKHSKKCGALFSKLLTCSDGCRKQ